MPTDSATSTVVVAAPLAQVLATIRAVEAQPEWVPEIREAEVLERYADGAPRTARFAASTPVGTDRYTLGYEHEDDGMRWHLVEGRLQTAQDATYSLVALDDDRTEATFSLTISHNLPLPGFVRSRVIKGLVTSTTSGLVSRLS
jgi:hypothetical protein